MTQPLVPDPSIPPPPESAQGLPAVSVGQQVHLIGIRKAIGVTLSGAVALAAVLVVVALWAAGFPVLKRDGTVTAGTLFELLKLVFAVVAGIGGVIALVVAYRRQRVTEAQNVLAHAADERAEAARFLAEAAEAREGLESERSGTRLFNERYAKAVEQLGSDKAAVRLGGLYALVGLADDWPAGRQTCVDVLCAYLRMPYTPPADDTDDEAAERAGVTDRAEWVRLQTRIREEQQVRHTVIRLIGAHLRDDAPVSWQGHNFDFTGALFDGGDLRRANFTGGMVNFFGATFSDGAVFFTGATFSGGTVSFNNANFFGGKVSFFGARFSGGAVTFTRATFSDGVVNFGDAAFSGGEVSFGGARFSGGAVLFTRARFSGSEVNFGARFSGGAVDFIKAEFSGGVVSFGGVKFSGSAVLFTRAKFFGGMVDLSQPSLWETRPVFDRWKGGPPTGLLLPAPRLIRHQFLSRK